MARTLELDDEVADLLDKFANETGQTRTMLGQVFLLNGMNQIIHLALANGDSRNVDLARRTERAILAMGEATGIETPVVDIGPLKSRT